MSNTNQVSDDFCIFIVILGLRVVDKLFASVDMERIDHHQFDLMIRQEFSKREPVVASWFDAAKVDGPCDVHEFGNIHANHQVVFCNA